MTKLEFSYESFANAISLAKFKIDGISGTISFSEERTVPSDTLCITIRVMGVPTDGGEKIFTALKRISEAVAHIRQQGESS